MPNESWRDGDVSKANIEYVSGINDVMQGRRPPSVQSAEAIRLLTESSKTILRPKARLIEGAVKQLGQLLIDYIQAGYTTERMMRVLGYDNSNGEQMTFNSPQVQGNVDSIKNDITLGEYDVYVTPDSTLPKSDIERFDKLAQLGQMNFVDRTALLSVSGLENWQEIDQRMQKKEDEFKAQQDMGKENEQLKQQLQQMGQQMQQLQAQAQQGQNRPPNESINFKDLPPAGKVAMAQQVGIDLSGVNPAELVTPVKGVGAP